ncbi:TolC family outer membrane protein [Pelagibacteraceae bacterium]|nr:TolC family outer membrane protein [Pelagibacteraceae bacterium]
MNNLYIKKNSHFYLLIFFLISFNHNLFSQSIYESFEAVYKNSPILKSNRLKLEALNEEIVKVLSKKRPHINLYSTIGSDKTKTLNTSKIESTKNNNPKTINLEVSQNLYDSGRTKFDLNKTDSLILAQRAELLHEEQSIFLKTADSYLMLLAKIEIHKLSKSNLKVLRRYYESTKSRFDVGEATTTDLALSKAKFLSGQSDEIKARGDIEIEKSKFYSIVGEEAPNKLNFPNTDIKIPEKLKSLIKETLKENPKIIEYGLKKKSSFSDVSLSASKLLPQLDLNFTAQNAWAPNTFFEEYENYKVELSLNIPLYSGGYNYSDLRQKKKNAIQSSKYYDYIIKNTLKESEVLWVKQKSLESQVSSLKATINANVMALEGIKKEAEVGARTILNILDAEQDVLEEKVDLVRLKKDIFYNSFSILAQTGKLNAKDLNLKVNLYDNNKHYLEIKKIWLGFVQ